MLGIPGNEMVKYTIVTEPNSRFVTKHVCTTCQDTVEDAEAFAVAAHAARRANGWATTGKNTVFIASNMVYVTDEGRTVIIFQDAVPKYDCEPRGEKKWSCRRKGLKRAKHDPNSGHYDYRNDLD